jgi:hypothetical protein
MPAFGDPSTVVKRFEWNADLEMSLAYAAEDHLLEALRIEISSLAGKFPKSAEILRGISLKTRVTIAKHPYIAGHLKRELALTHDQLHYNIMMQIARGTARNSDYNLWMETDYEGILPIPSIEGRSDWTASVEPRSAREEINALLEEAAENMFLVSKAAFSFVTSNVWWLALRRDNFRKETFSSYTFVQLPGLVLLCNLTLHSVGSFFARRNATPRGNSLFTLLE